MKKTQNLRSATAQTTKHSTAMKSRLIIAGLVMSFGTLAYAATFTPIPLNPSSFNADPVIEATAPPSLNDFVGVTGDAGTNKTGNIWYEMGYNTNVYAIPTYSGPLTGLPLAGTTFTARATNNHSFQMAPSYTTTSVILVGHNNN